MKLLVLNASPRKNGNVAKLCRAIAQAASNKYEIEWVEVYDLKMAACVACMKCRPDNPCVLHEDDAHHVGRLISNADALVVGTPTYWSNMSAPLKLLFDRNVTTFITESARGLPIPRQKGKPAIIVTACTAPWPLNAILFQSRGAIKNVKAVLATAGYNIKGSVVAAGTKNSTAPKPKAFKKAKDLAQTL